MLAPADPVSLRKQESEDSLKTWSPQELAYKSHSSLPFKERYQPTEETKKNQQESIASTQKFTLSYIALGDLTQLARTYLSWNLLQWCKQNLLHSPSLLYPREKIDASVLAKAHHATMEESI